MARWRKKADCLCAPCARFRADGPQLWRDIARIEMHLDPADVAALRRDLLAKGCDWCGRDAYRVPFVPQIVKDYLRIEHLCEWCRNVVVWHQRKEGICWGASSDDELKWFLAGFVLQKLNDEIRRRSPSGIAKEKAHQEWLASLPKTEDEPPQDLNITIKRVRPRTIEAEAIT